MEIKLKQISLKTGKHDFIIRYNNGKAMGYIDGANIGVAMKPNQLIHRFEVLTDMKDQLKLEDFK
jgi:hypothetical protein